MVSHGRVWRGGVEEVVGCTGREVELRGRGGMTPVISSFTYGTKVNETSIQFLQGKINYPVTRII